MAPVKRQTHVRYPYPAFNFQVYVTGIADDPTSVTAAFSEVTGLQVQKKVIEYRDGADEPFMQKGGGLNTVGDITLKQGVTGSVEFWQWMQSGLSGAEDRRDGGLIMLDEDRNEVMRWLFRNAWPIEFVAPTFNAMDSKAAILSLKICAERVEIQTN